MNSFSREIRSRDEFEKHSQILFKRLCALKVVTGDVRSSKSVRICSVCSEYFQCVFSVGHIEHLVLQKVGDACRGINKLSVKSEAPPGSAVAGRKNGISRHKLWLFYNFNPETVGKHSGKDLLANTGIFFKLHIIHYPNPPYL